jgi:uncharacterized repeat protein (TIGR03847 family)
MAATEIDVDPVIHITTDAIGKPGQRVFYIQAWQADRTITLIVEKVQIQTLAIGVEQFLSEIKERFPDLTEASSDFDDTKMRIQPPVDPLFRVGSWAWLMTLTGICWYWLPEKLSRTNKIQRIPVWCVSGVHARSCGR